MRHFVILIAKRVYHVRETIIGLGLLDQPNDLAVLVFEFTGFDVFNLTASSMSAFSAASSTVSSSWKSMARTVLLSRRVLKSFFGSFIRAPLWNVSLTAFLSISA